MTFDVDWDWFGRPVATTATSATYVVSADGRVVIEAPQANYRRVGTFADGLRDLPLYAAHNQPVGTFATGRRRA